MDKVLLIRSSETYEPIISPPLGMLYLASTVRERFKSDIKLIDLQIHPGGMQSLGREIERYNPDLIGFSAMSSQYRSICGISSAIKEKYKKIPLVIGGPFTYAGPEEIFERTGFDYIVHGEGEEVLCDLISCLGSNGDLGTVRGLSYRDEGRIIMNEPQQSIVDLDALPFPAFDLTDIGAFSNRPRCGYVYKNKRYFPILTSRGCPFRCYYCHSIFGSRFRSRSARNVVEEIGVLHGEHGVEEIQVFDDVFNFNRERAIEIFQGIVDSGYHLSISFPNGVRGDMVDAELIRWMKRAGVFKVNVAIETASERLQKESNKRIDIEAARRSMEMFVENRIMTHCYLMVGLPGETRWEIDLTLNFPRKTPCHSASFFILRPFPGTRAYEIYRDVSQAAPSSGEYLCFYVHQSDEHPLSELKPSELRKKIRYAALRFYGNPLRLWRIVRDIPSKGQLILLGLRVVSANFLPWLFRLQGRSWRLGNYFRRKLGAAERG